MPDIQLIDIDPESRVVSFKVFPAKLTGISLLIQVVVLSILNIPGKDILNPERGGGLPALVGGNIDVEDSTELVADITARVSKSEAEIIEAQVGLNVPAEESLRELRILDISQGVNLDEVFLRLRIINENGRASDVLL